MSAYSFDKYHTVSNSIDPFNTKVYVIPKPAVYLMYGFPEFTPLNQGKCVVEAGAISALASESPSSTSSEDASSYTTAVQQAMPSYESLFGLSASSLHTTDSSPLPVDDGNYWNDEILPTNNPSDVDITTITIPTEFPNPNAN